jgi:hypothetical protein
MDWWESAEAIVAARNRSRKGLNLTWADSHVCSLSGRAINLRMESRQQKVGPEVPRI